MKKTPVMIIILLSAVLLTVSSCSRYTTPGEAASSRTKCGRAVR